MSCQVSLCTLTLLRIKTLGNSSGRKRQKHSQLKPGMIEACSAALWFLCLVEQNLRQGRVSSALGSVWDLGTEQGEASQPCPGCHQPEVPKILLGAHLSGGAEEGRVDGTFLCLHVQAWSSIVYQLIPNVQQLEMNLSFLPVNFVTLEIPVVFRLNVS